MLPQMLSLWRYGCQVLPFFIPVLCMLVLILPSVGYQFEEQFEWIAGRAFLIISA